MGPETLQSICNGCAARDGTTKVGKIWLSALKKESATALRSMSPERHHRGSPARFAKAQKPHFLFRPWIASHLVGNSQQSNIHPHFIRVPDRIDPHRDASCS